MLTPDTGQVCLDDAASVATYTVTGDLAGMLVHRRVDDPERNTVRMPSRPAALSCSSAASALVAGSFWTTYTFTYKVVDGIEVHGRCHHPIVGGNGGFARREGRAPDARPAERVRDLQGPPLLLTATRQPPGDRAARARPRGLGVSVRITTLGV